MFKFYQNSLTDQKPRNTRICQFGAQRKVWITLNLLLFLIFGLNVFISIPQIAVCRKWFHFFKMCVLRVHWHTKKNMFQTNQSVDKDHIFKFNRTLVWKKTGLIHFLDKPDLNQSYVLLSILKNLNNMES